MSSNTLYDRQRHLLLKFPRKVVIMGAGGIGSWVALDLALIGVEHLVIIDPDVVEEHNLNRTPFRTNQVGLPKVAALKELIFERRPDCRVDTFINVEDNLTNIQVKKIRRGAELLVDTRDRKLYVPPYWADLRTIALGYDGRGVTMIINPEYPVGNDSYRTITSYLVAPQLLAALATELITNPEFSELWEKKNFVVSGSVHGFVLSLLEAGKEVGMFIDLEGGGEP